MNRPVSDRHVPEYWDIIRCDSTRFLSSHLGYESRLYHGEIEPDLVRDVYQFARAVAAGMARILQGFISSVSRRRRVAPPSREDFLLLITVGGPKYAGEERQISEACRSRGLRVRTVYLLSESEGGPPAGSSLTTSALTPSDYARALVSWLWRAGRGSGHLFSSDAQKRSLFVASMNGIRQDCILTRFAHRVVATFGRPRLVLSLAPTAAVSVTLVEYMKRQGVLTASMRTQTTHAEPELFAINTEILFCKGRHERRAYQAVFGDLGPRLEDGCVLSLPESYDLEPLRLPEKYALLLGTSPRYDQSSDDGRAFEDKLYQAAAAAGLPAVAKMHNLAADWDAQAQGSGSVLSRAAAVETDTRRNRELIDRASLVVSGPTTLLYYVLLRGVPSLIVEPYPSSRLPDEFLEAPLGRVLWEESVNSEKVLRAMLAASVETAKSWFEENYFLRRDGAWVIDYLLKCADGAGAGGGEPSDPLGG
jgi:hypothetical protein